MEKCLRCGKEFEKYQWNQKRCYDCIAETDKRFKGKPKRRCPVCNKEFQPRTIRQEFCSDKCSNDGWLAGYLRRTYGIAIEDYTAMYEKQGGVCKICGSEGFKMNPSSTNGLCVDHDHETGEVRGLLCHNCNRALGLMKDDTHNIKNMILYLEGSETIRKE